MLEAYIYNNLRTVCEITPATRIALYEPEWKFYVVKKVSVEAAKIYAILKTLDSPVLPAILAIVPSEEGFEVVREYIAGDSLARVMEKEKTLPEERAVRLMEGVLDGLEVLHAAGLVHRDVNPNNIIVTTEGTAKLIDFGIMRAYTEPKSSDTAILGTPGYAAPEQFGFRQSDQRTDIYAAGVLLNVMLTGKLPKDAPASGRCGKIIRKCIEIDAGKRYQSVAEVRAALGSLPKKVTKEERVSTGLDKVISAVPGLRSRRPWVAALAVVWYLMALLMMVSVVAGVQEKSFEACLRAVVCDVLIFVLPYFCFFDFLGVWELIPFTRGASGRNQRLFYWTFGVLLIFCGIWIMPSSA